MLLKPVISIIVPMYNSENTIEKCLDSLKKQTQRGLEIIIIDDASSDQSYSIANEFRKKFPNTILLRNEKNIGAGASKNKALKVANADIIGFVDSDDFIEESYYENMISAMREFTADIACSDIALTYDRYIEYSHLLINNPYIDVENIVIKSADEVQLISPEVAAAHWGAASAPAKVFKRAIIEEFYEGVCDDLLFTFTALARAKKVVYVAQNYYYYVQGVNSLERSCFSEKRLDLANSLSVTADIILNDIRQHTKIVELMYAYSSWPIILDILELDADRDRYLNQYYLDLRYRDKIMNNPYFRYNILGLSMGKQRFLHEIIESFCEKKFERMYLIFDENHKYSELYLPKVSIVIPVYNGSNYLNEAIESALMQNYPKLEIIVINDGSDDNNATERIAMSFGERIKYYYKENGGVASALNFGIDKMSGEYFSWLSHDDLYTPDKIRSQIEALRSLPDKKTVVICGYEVINQKRQKLYSVNLLDLYDKEEVERPLFAVFRGGINGCSVLIHKSHFERVGNFDINLPTTQDYDLWFRIMRGQKIHYMSENYVLSRSHEEQDSKKLFDKHLKECNKLWIRLIKQLEEEEINQISDTKYEFYLKEKKFFSQTPYKKVEKFLDSKLLDIIRDSLETKDSYAVNVLYELFGFSKDIFKFKEFWENFNDEKDKCFIVLLESKVRNKEIWKTTRIIEKSIKLSKCIFVVISEQDICWAEQKNIFKFPITSINSLPHLIKLLNGKLCIIDNDIEYEKTLLYTSFSAMGIRTIAWNMQQHWLLCGEVNQMPRSEKFIDMEEADISVWSDIESATIDACGEGDVVYIPLFMENEDSAIIEKKWIQILEVKTKMESLFTPQITEINLLTEIIVKCQKIISRNIEKQTIKPQVVEKVIYREVENDWEKRYNAIANSTFWKLTGPMRALTDIVKKVKKS